VVALQLDHAVLRRAADAAALLQPAGELAQRGVVERDVGDRRDGLAAAAGRLPAHLHGAARGAQLGQTRIARLAQVAVAAGPDDLRIAALGHRADASTPIRKFCGFSRRPIRA